MERADNYDELLDIYEEKNDIDVAELEWGVKKKRVTLITSKT